MSKLPEPTTDPETGVPFCTEDCGRYDGKRCELLGRRPGPMCEPAVVQLVRELRAAKREIRRWQTGATIEGDFVPPDVNTACGECLKLCSTPLGTAFSCSSCGAEYDIDHALVREGRH